MAFGDYVQSAKTDAGSTTSSSTTFGSATTSGNTILVGVRRSATTGTITVTDNKGNTYTQDATVDSVGDHTHRVYRCSNITGGASHQITVQFSGAAAMRYEILEYVGNFALHGTPPTAAGNSTSPNSGNQVTTVTALIFGSVTGNGNAAVVWSAGTGYTTRESLVSASQFKIAAEDKGAVAAGTHAATGSFGATSDPWTAIMCAYSDASGGGSPRQQTLSLLGVGV